MVIFGICNKYYNIHELAQISNGLIHEIIRDYLTAFWLSPEDPIVSPRVDTKGDNKNPVKKSVYHIFQFTVLMCLTLEM